MIENEIRIPRTLAAIHVEHMVMYPYLMVPLVVSDKSMKQVIEYAISTEKLLGFFLSRDMETDSEKQNEIEISEYGTAVNILRMLRNSDGTISLLLQGVSRIRIEKVIQKSPFMKVEIETIPENLEESPKINAIKKVTFELLDKVISESPDINRELSFGLKSIKQLGRIADIIAGNVAIKLEQKQKILEALSIADRFNKLNQYLAEHIKQLRIENRIRNSIQLEIDEDQRRYYLHEQLEAIQKELGETNEIDQEINKWKKKIIAAKLPEHVLEVANEEIERLEMMTPASSEYSVIRNYLEWIVTVPWSKRSKDRLDLKKINSILTKDHYGLEKPKERILEFIAVKKLKKDNLQGPILCFVGPPGVGKTSLGKSIANAMKRKFIRISLGGIHDEAEIRGHRRTYIGAMPGKIINELKRVGTRNPVFMLDEIDKIGKDFRGDPSSALLEVLDPEQNSTFIDNYLNLHFDLSDVMFITTANSLSTIPPPLRDRMEIIEFSSYIESEKLNIARNYLIPKETYNNGLTGKNIKLMNSGILELIRYYVREAGVRSLQRSIGSICRKVARKVAEGNPKQVIVTAHNVKDFLGNRKVSHEMAKRKPEIGIVTGLAWTSFGGEILFCESSLMPGKGRLILTGLLGEVMQESAKIAMSYLKSNYEKYNIDIKEISKKDIHIHLPSGSVPKDGPSAGVTLTTSLASLFSKRKIHHEIALTGEITLQGKVLPIGGVREKFLAAKRAGIKKVLFPEENRDNVYEISEKIRKGIEIEFIENIDQVLEIMLLD